MSKRLKNVTSPLWGTALITGGTSGIGLAFARALARRGCALVLVARSQERLEKTASELRSTGVAVETLAADLGTEAGVTAVAERLHDQSSPIEVFVNNAGQGLYHELATTDTQPLEDAINLMGTTVVRLGAIAAAAMKARGHGVIINTASVSALVPMGLYSGIKAMVRTWSVSLGIEVKPAGVHVMTFMPGWVRTEFHKRAGVERSNVPDFIWLQPADVVRDCLDDVDAGKVYSVPSVRFKVISAVAAHAPKEWVWAISAKINKGRRG
ncbi:MAG: SDR family NAD(P)-dependent oxidoreductase [Ancrocorticia sp.]|nr:SDR family NAD(P)-dependent oxidoreductase [Ancrocorticia sp.]MCI1932940.1 SDR family NAD(P)-dependent oxidoreductase [Ancrocorticia sp.]MCI1962702.1 SDR family NAD(P)-dependent oxidoreductase [Ancrocorticia sp.]MCI2002017.1 SDR family NAD(P)-dependent oxidoreductase [Ancrocorticia sp.]MCI2012497.1 SDR family NAD(P)-dependent oxidoreductase [Ancrocorticia sp.]